MRAALRHPSRFPIFLAAAILLPIAVIPVLGNEPTPVRAPTTITADTTWEGPILVDAAIIVPAGTTLTLRPGATLRFRGDAGLTVLGALRAEGSAEQPVAFLAEGNGPWAGIVLANVVQPSLLKNCRILAARALVISAGDHVVEQCEITAGAIGVDITGDNARPVLRANRIHDMREGGIRCLGKSTPLIESNTIESCGPFGVHASQGAAPLIRGNTIVACASGIELVQTAPFVRDNRVRKCEQGITLTSTSGGKPVQGNTVEDCGTGILVQQFSSPEVSGNTVVRNKDGIVCYQGARPLIRNNTVEKNATGITCVQLANAVIEANVISGNKRGIFLETSSYATVRGNDIIDNAVQMELGTMMSADWEKRAGTKPQRGRQQQAQLRGQRGGMGPAVIDASRENVEISGSVDATENWWGENATREMVQKGPDANIAGMVDAFDHPTRSYEGYDGEFAQDRIRYAPWAKERIATAGIPVSIVPGGQGESR